MKKNEIFMIYGTDYLNMTKKILEKSDLQAQILNKNDLFGIKPNLVSPTEASWGATTHPEIMVGIIEYLQEREYKNIVILESSWVGDKTAEAVKVCGYDKIVKTYGVDFWDMQKDRSHEENCAGMKLQICDGVRKIDFLINVPVLKGHCQTKITCALKNLKGLIPNREKRHFHSMGLHRPIAHLAAAIRQDFIVVDNICGDLDFEDGGNPVVMNRVLTAADPVLCDAFVCDMLNYKKDEIPYLVLAEKLGVGCGDLSKAKICEINGLEYKDLKIEHDRKVVELEDAVEEVESCSACYGYLIPALDRLRREGLLEKLNTKICIGQGYRKKQGILGIGSCTGGFQHSLKGCPPTENDIYQFLKNYIDRSWVNCD